MIQDELRAKAERAANEFRNSKPHRSSHLKTGYVAGYLAHAKKAEALVDVLERIAHPGNALGGYVANEMRKEALEALARYRGGSSGK